MPEATPFRIHVGPFATGSNLVRDVDIWNKLGDNQRLIRSLDMEASVIGFAAFVQERPWIVAKGVMDFAEPGRSQGFRKFAARASAEVLIAFLRENLSPIGRSVEEILRRGTSKPLARRENPAMLLTARYETVSFVESARSEELRTLMEWCSDAEPLSMLLLTAPGGAGKTRLVMELVKRQRALEWMAGFLDNTTTEDERTLVFRSERQTLVAIDYAETWHGLRPLLESIALQRPAARLRLLLVARDTGDWWTDLQRGSARLVDILRASNPLNLVPKEVSVERRREVFDRSRHDLAPHVDGHRSDTLAAIEVDLSHERFGRMLYLSMAALAALRGSSLEHGRLLGDTIEHEKRYLELRCLSNASESTPDDRADLLRRISRLLAAATLRGGLRSRQDAEILCERIKGPSASTSPHALQILHDFYGRPNHYIGALEPDLLGEELVHQVLSEANTPGDYLVRAFEGADSSELRQGFVVLGRVEERQPHQHFRDGIRALLRCDVAARAPAALAAALALGRHSAHVSLGQVMYEVLREHGTAELAKDFHARIPVNTVSLSEVAYWAKERLLSSLPRDARSERATALLELGTRLSALGRREEARAATDEAVQEYRTLSNAWPNVFLPYLAGSLNNLGRRLQELGSSESALAATEEAVFHYRALMKAQPEHLQHLAGTLQNLGNDLGKLERREEALAATKEAAGYLQLLANEQPERFLPYRASLLNDLGARLSRLGEHKEALAASEEAVFHYRALTKAHPDAFLPDLAMSLSNLGAMLGNVQKPEDALAASEEAVFHYRTLAKTRDAFLPYLARSLHNMSVCLKKCGRSQDALTASEDAVFHCRALAELSPAAFLADLALLS